MAVSEAEIRSLFSVIDKDKVSVIKLDEAAAFLKVCL